MLTILKCTLKALLVSSSLAACSVAVSSVLLLSLVTACGTDTSTAKPPAKADSAATDTGPAESGAPALGENTTGSGPALAIISQSVLPAATLPQPANAAGTASGGDILSSLLGGGGNILGSLTGAVSSLTGGLGIGNITSLLGGLGGLAGSQQAAAGNSK